MPPSRAGMVNPALTGPDGVSERQRLSPAGWRSAATTVPLHLTVSGVIQGERMDETSGATQTARAKDEFFSVGMYMFRITGFPQQPGVLTRQAKAPRASASSTKPSRRTASSPKPSPSPPFTAAMGSGGASGAAGPGRPS